MLVSLQLFAIPIHSLFLGLRPLLLIHNLLGFVLTQRLRQAWSSPNQSGDGKDVDDDVDTAMLMNSWNSLPSKEPIGSPPLLYRLKNKTKDSRASHLLETKLWTLNYPNVGAELEEKCMMERNDSFVTF